MIYSRVLSRGGRGVQSPAGKNDIYGNCGAAMTFGRDCGPCSGHGYYGYSPKETCEVCGGKGENTLLGEPDDYKDCGPCSGHGYYGYSPKETCRVCRGVGLLKRSTSTLESSIAPPKTDEPPPDFSPLAADQVIKDILVRRWQECRKCLHGGAHLAATVMMGGLLEALFVARANRLKDKAPLFKCKATPIDEKTKKPLDLREWTLRPYIDVGFELGWISKSGKDVAAVLRDYRNYVHPEKERSHGVALTEHDSAMFWEVTKSLVKQLLS